MDLLGNKQAWEILNKFNLEVLYQKRIRPYKFIADKSKKGKVDKKDLEVINRGMSMLLHEKYIDVGKEKYKISLYDFSVYVESLHLYWRNAAKENEEIGARFKACFPLFNDDFMNIRTKVLEEVKRLMDYVTFTYSDSFSHILSYKKEDPDSSLHSVFHNNYLLLELNPDTETISLDGHNRTIYKVCYAINELFYPLAILPEKLGLNGVSGQLPIQVYIQRHVLERMEERLDRFFSICNYGFIIYPLFSGEILPAEKKNSFLIPLEYQHIRLGYFEGDLVGDKLIIRTFLFITNSGTPEGKKLENLLGLQMADKKYLGIDKLSTFINSDIKKDERLMGLFRQSGCGDLINLKIKLMGPAGDKEIAIAQYLSEYIGLETIPAEEPFPSTA